METLPYDGGGPLAKYPGALSEPAPYSALYTLQITERYHNTGEEGPLWSPAPERLGLFLALLAAKWRSIFLEWSWVRYYFERQNWPLISCAISLECVWPDSTLTNTSRGWVYPQPEDPS
eukprot:2235043-Pyramimonas_sp.AAC.1